MLISDFGFSVFDVKSLMPSMSIKHTVSAKSNGGNSTLNGTGSVIERPVNARNTCPICLPSNLLVLGNLISSGHSKMLSWPAPYAEIIGTVWVLFKCSITIFYDELNLLKIESSVTRFITFDLMRQCVLYFLDNR